MTRPSIAIVRDLAEQQERERLRQEWLGQQDGIKNEVNE